MNIGYEHLPETGGKIRAETRRIRARIERILELSGEVKTVMMCSESKPLTTHKIPRANCHRIGSFVAAVKSQRRGADNSYFAERRFD